MLKPNATYLSEVSKALIGLEFSLKSHRISNDGVIRLIDMDRFRKYYRFYRHKTCK